MKRSLGSESLRRRLLLAAAVLTTLAAISPAVLRLAALPQEDKRAEEAKDGKKDETLPLKADGKVEFTTDEGTWMSLDVSPDGSTIVFDLLGDIYTVPVSGGEAKRIVGDLSFESQPKYAPDGRKIVFLSDRSGGENVWVCDPDGSNPQPVTKGRGAAPQLLVSPSWTPDSQYILASRSERPIGTFHVYMYHRDGGTGVSVGPPPPPPPAPDSQTPPAPQVNKMGAVAAPDGRYVYYAQRTGSFTYNARFPLWQIVRFDRETSETTTLTNAPGSAMRPVLSPDGKHLVYATRHRTQTALRVRELATGEERWLINGVTRDDQESRATRDTFPGYSFTPDGKSLIVPIGGRIQRVDFATGKATVIPFTAKVEAEIAPRLHFDYRIDEAPTFKSRLIRYPVLAPDGRRLAFSALNRIYVVDFPGGTPRRMTNLAVGEFMPAWSPDGRSLAFVTWSRDGGHIYRVSAEGGQPEQITRRPAYYSYPAWSPDGSKIVVAVGSVSGQLLSSLRNEEFGPEVPEEVRILHGESAGEITGVPRGTGLMLAWVPASGGDPTVIAPLQGGRYLHFTNDPERVYMTSNQGLLSIRLDGYDRRIHLKVTGVGEPPNPPGADAIMLSPDGRQAFVSLQGRHYLITVPKAGKETVTVNISGKGPSSVPVKKMAAEGGDYLAWSPDGKSVTWSWGTKFMRQEVSLDKPESIEVAAEARRARPQGTVVLSGARVVTMNGSEIIEKGDIVVTDNRIAAIGPKGKVSLPAGAKSIDVTGKTIIPGFVDVHAHMWPPRDVHQTQVWQYLANLAYGVTTSRDPQSSTTDVYAYADLVEAGEILGPRVFTTGPGVFSSLGFGDKDAARDYVRRYKEAYRTMTLKQYMTGDRLVRQWVAMACKEFGITPTTEGALDMKLDLTQMADGFSGHEHSLPIQPIYRDVIQYVAKTGTFYTPTTLVAYGAPFTENYFFEGTDVAANEKLRRFVPAEVLDPMIRRREQWFLPEEYGHVGIAKGAAAVVAAGGRVCLGGHGQLQGLGCHWELWALQSGGLSNHDALRVATIFGAEAIGLRQDVGSLEPGKLADLIVLDQDPLKDIRNTNTIRFVMKNGELFVGDTLEQLWPVQRKLEPQFWWSTAPPAPAQVQ